MHLAVTHLRDVVELAAAVALEHVQVRPDLPVDFTPRDAIGFAHKRDELLKVPRLVDDMLGADLPVAIDVGLGFRAVQNLALAHREQLVAVCTLVQVVGFFFEK